VLKWIVERVDGKDIAEKSAIGYLPKKGSLDISGLEIDDATLQKLTSVNFSLSLFFSFYSLFF